MSDIKHQQSKMLSQHSVEDQDNSILQVVQKSPSEINEVNVVDYLQDCVNKFLTKDSGIHLSSTPICNSNIESQLKNKNNDYKNNIELDFIKIENIFLQNIPNSQNELRFKCIEQNHLKMKNESAESITHLDEKSTNSIKSIKMNNAIDTEDVKSNNIPIKVKKAFVLEKNIFTQVKDKSYNLEVKNENLNDENNDPETKFITSNNQSKIKINNLVMLNKQVKTCSQCSMTFRYKRHLDRHLEGHQKNNCSHCSAKFARRKHLDIHLFRSHGERVTKYPHSCDVCSRSFPKRILLNRHRAKHNYENGKVCSDCGEMLKVEEDDKEHKENHCTRKQFKCKRCLQTFSIEQTYIAHIQNHDNHKCPKCDVTFASKKKVHEHYKMVHSSKLNHNKISNNGIYFCTDCRHTFLKKDDYSRHLDSTLHLNKVNREIFQRDIFTCLICSKKLISQRALDQHVRRIHKEEKRFTCNIYGCTFQCARKSDLDRHRQLHVEQRNVVCEQCGKTFTSVSILNDHVLYIHNKERQFICEECGKAFKRNSLLKRHKLSHQQYRPFACMQCSTAFKRSHHLSRHMETCHRITLEKKKKVVKLMKTEDGHLVPVPEKPKKLKPKKLKMKAGSNKILSSDDKSVTFQNMDINNKYSDSYLEAHTLLNSNDLCENSALPLELTNVLSNTDFAPQVLSLVDINAEQIVTVEVTTPKTLIMNDLVDQLEINCNEILNLTNYQDLELGVSNTDQNLYDHINYSELSLETAEGTSFFVDSNINKLDTLPIENYLNQSFPSFLNF
ncbi:zinc finger protein 90-like [Bombus affinis]|uniref:zinc finger protein 90-like n=1 Tax=Bombus affinis TaxID=309941 RepID=UPI0021B7C2AA|nr:zinc finger protein 90-like [Bombus affinis]XP_050585092.1 zinc finger protein 90-like [Bombus affinis]XP_050585100.1 zinc finger protein 90-like [Bombus affinis]